MANNVVFKGTVNGIQVVLKENVPFETIISEFKEKLEMNKAFFEGADVNLSFKGRELSQEEQDEIMSMLTNQSILGVSFVHKFGEREEQIPEKLVTTTKIEAALLEPNTAISKVYTGIIRSGTHINFDGTVIILGDVNPGAYITASENIIVLGNLKGRVHAGVGNSSNSNFIAALKMSPSHIGINNVIALSPDNQLKNKKPSIQPRIAYMKDEQIYLDEIDISTINYMFPKS